ncbi:MAG: FAD-binding protein [Gemmatimonadaceae bacterium]|nr:FAD-binding protein [Gemmatimonadaceae bacterium]
MSATTAPRVVTPRDVDALAGLLRQAHASRTPVRITGASTWRNAGRPVATPHDVLDVRALAGVIEYEPGDLVLTVGAATTLAEIDAVTAPHGQWIGLDPFGTDAGTIGATVATASVGPLSYAYGAPRDQLLGLAYVTGEGTVAHGGGRVVKNVAGFDVVRLHCGAWGTLGVITSVSLRCFARPAAEATLALPLPERATARDELLDTLRNAAIAPFACVVVDGALAARLGRIASPCVLLRLGGNAAALRAQCDVVAALGPAELLDQSAWRALRAMDDEALAVARVSARPASLGAAWQHVDAALQHSGIAADAVRRAALLDRGVIRLAIDRASDEALTTLIARLAPPGGAVRWESLPASCWPFVRSAVDDALSKRVRAAFDPARILNRGVLGEQHLDAAITTAPPAMPSISAA